MPFIDDHCGTHANFARQQLMLARMKLKHGALAIGEKHTDATARAVVLDLISAGALTKLFFEAPDLGMGLCGGKQEDGFVSAHFHKKAEDRASLKGDPVWKAFKQISKQMFTRHKNPIDIYTMIKHAVPHGVKVYFYDRKHFKKPGEPEAMKARNEDMGKIFTECAGPDEPGVILLVGTSHLFPLPSGGVYDNTLQGTCKIPLNRVIDLSMLGPKGLAKQHNASGD